MSLDTTQPIERLRNIEAKVIALANSKIVSEDDFRLPLYKKKLEQLEASHSRSWFGDHSSTYYKDFEMPPAGRSFDVEWGFVLGFNGSNNPGWIIYSRSAIQEFVFSEIGEEICSECHIRAQELVSEFTEAREQALALLEIVNIKPLDRYIQRIGEDMKPYTIAEYINGKAGQCPRMTRDSEEIAKGSMVPAHIQYFSTIQSFEVNIRKLNDFAKALRGAIDLIAMASVKPNQKDISRRVFIGHGRSEQWRILKDFIHEKLGLEYEEFNRVSTAGINTQERLEEMLNSCGFAFLIMTAEDVRSDSSLHARENVVHECGLFQGRLGWRRAIVLLENGCEEFSNIVGLGQIRFPKDNIAACFEQIRDVIKRESLPLGG